MLTRKIKAPTFTFIKTNVSSALLGLDFIVVFIERLRWEVLHFLSHNCVYIFLVHGEQLNTCMYVYI